ncbi:MAG: bifunctional 4-hydroxy-2-oxoglutarate aldolase/2-dehydro-3-deoxy-phosphogluconate aldolase [Candidatus Omnitrophica bacterium]|nr:bifunctional 4-hydroxy-2-oxoglutarate aldolase/2-dehydro-3-deoxy-phosphogluconate aldolase [Candidatus Omnitrophota bacterium]
MDIQRFKKLPIMGIIRGIGASSIEPLTEAIIASGLETIEITMNTPEAVDLIKKAVSVSSGRLMIGAGTVLTMKDLRSALKAGAGFIVMPVLIPEVTAYCLKKRIPVFPGALTPQEIFNAWKAGATMVKVFPSGFLGPKYFKEIKGPFADIELMAVGGVRPDNVQEFFKYGASAVAVGASIFDLELIRQGKFERIKNELILLVNAVRISAHLTVLSV